MADIVRDSEVVELNEPPRFNYGERVVSRSTVRNDGTFCGAEIGEVLVKKGDIGYVTSIGNFLQQYYIYAVEWVDKGYRVGMRGKELMSLDHLPPEILEQLGPEKVAQLNALKGQ
jgi:nitrogen fixation protein NifZ